MIRAALSRFPAAVSCWLLFTAVCPVAGAGLRILTPEGSPVENAWVTPADSDSEGMQVTDASGRVTLATMPAGDLCISAQGLETRRIRIPASDVEMTLGPERSLAGRVSNLNGAPISGVWIGVDPESPLGPCIPPVLSDENGRFRMVGLPASSLPILLDGGDAYLERKIQVRLPAGESPGLEARLLRAVTPRVLVRDAKMRPLPGVQARILPEWEEYPLPFPPLPAALEEIEDWRGASDDEGILRLPRLPEREQYRVVLKHESLAPSSLRISGLPGGAVATATMGPGGSLSLRVLDEARNPLPEAEIMLRGDPASDLDLLALPFHTGEDGRLLQKNIPPGLYSLHITHPEARPALRPGLQLKDGGLAELGEVLLEPGAVCEGRIVDPRSGGVDDAQVRVKVLAEEDTGERSARSDASGRFRIPGLDPRAVLDLEVLADGYAPYRLQRVAADCPDLVAELTPTLTLSGNVLEAGTERPVATFLVTARPEPDTGTRPLSATGSDGRFALEGLAPGRYERGFDSPRHAPMVSEPLKVPSSEEDPRVFLLEPGRSLDGRVVRKADGNPLSGASVEAAMSAGILRRATTGPGGGFRLEGLALPVRLTAKADGFQSASRRIAEIHLTEGPVTLALAGGGRVEGMIYGGDGAPLAGAEVSAPGGRKAVSDPGGWYRLEGLPAGPVHLRKVNRPGSAEGLETAQVLVSLDEPARHDFGAGARLEGRVRYRGSPVPHARLALSPAVREASANGEPDTYWSSPPSHVATTDAAGDYSMSGVAPGFYLIESEWMGRRFSKPLEIPPGQERHRFDLDIPDLRLEGRVVDRETGEGLAGVRLEAYREENTGALLRRLDPETGTARFLQAPLLAEDASAPDGSFRILLGEEGPVYLTASKPGLQSVEGKSSWQGVVKESVTGLRLELSRTTEIALTILDADTGSTLRNAAIDVRPPGSGEFLREEPGGVHRIRVATDTPVTLLVTKRGYAPAIESQLRFTPGGSHTTQLTRGGAVRLRAPEGALRRRGFGFQGGLHIVDARGRDLMGWIATHHLLAQAAVRHSPDEWTLHLVPPGEWTLRLDASGRAATVIVAAGSTAEADLR